MRGFLAAGVMILSAVCAGWSGQSAPSAMAGQSLPPSASVSAPDKPALASPDVDRRSGKQKELAEQAQRLVDMATELKVQVDKTNKNILSLDVVRKAEEIETLAHRMKEQARR